MANRLLNRDRGSILKGLVDIYATVNVGAAGAVTLQQWNYPSLGQLSTVGNTYSAAPTTGGGNSFPNVYVQGEAGVFSVTRTGAGLWTVVMQDTYLRLIELRAFSTLAGGLSAIVQAAQNSTISNLANQSPGSIVGVALLSATATALDPANGEQIVLKFTFQDASEP